MPYMIIHGYCLPFEHFLLPGRKKTGYSIGHELNMINPEGLNTQAPWIYLENLHICPHCMRINNFKLM